MIGAGGYHDASVGLVLSQQEAERADRRQRVATCLIHEDSVVIYSGFVKKRGHYGGLGRAVTADRAGRHEARARMVFGEGDGGFDPAAEGLAGCAVRPNGGSKDQDRHQHVNW